MKKFLKENLSFILVILLALFIRTTKVAAINFVDGESMMPTYYNGQIVFGSSIKKLERGDIIVAKPDKKLVIKRLIGLPGETVESKNGNIYINGVLLEEPYLESERNIISKNYEWKVELGENEYFYMGDNRDNSYDCRAYGPVDSKKIIEKIY